MHLQIPHKANKIAALTKVKKMLQEGRSQLSGVATIDEERWEGDTLHFAAKLQGKQITGTLQVTDKDFVIDAKFPLLWRIFEGKIEKMIGEQVQSMGV
jgi:Putative polyhydroxyalkanoic acid system protein (PHA_gran_rgn)